MSRPLVIHGTLPGGAPFRIAMDPSCYVVMVETGDEDPIVCTRAKPRTIEQARAIGEVALAMGGEGPADVQDLNHGLAPSSPEPDLAPPFDAATLRASRIPLRGDPGDPNRRVRSQPDPDPPDDDPIDESPRERIACALANDNGLSWDEADPAVWLEYADACLRQTRAFAQKARRG